MVRQSEGVHPCFASCLRPESSFVWQPKSEDPREGRINLWEGAQMSTYSRQAAEWDSSGYGPLVSMTSVSTHSPLPCFFWWAVTP